MQGLQHPIVMRNLSLLNITFVHIQGVFLLVLPQNGLSVEDGKFPSKKSESWSKTSHHAVT